jgi:predicted outer membrane repeat protein
MKKALMLRGLLAAATLSLGSVALAGSAGATNLTINMYVGTNSDNVTQSTIDTWFTNAQNAPSWQDLTDTTNTTSGAAYAAYLDCHAASNTDCTLRETVALSLVNNTWWMQSAVEAAIAGDLAEAYACDMGNDTSDNCTAAGYSVGTATAAQAQNDVYSLTNSQSVAVADLSAGPSAWSAYTRYAINFTQLKATYTISNSSGGAIPTDSDTNLVIAGRGANNTVIVGNGDTGAFSQNNGSPSGANALTLSDMTFKNFYNSSSGSVLYAAGNASTTLSNVSFSRNIGGDYGTVYSTGTLTITGGNFIKNDSDYGGAIYSDGTATVTGTEFSGNAATRDGGAIYFGGNTLTVSSSSFDHNVSEDTDYGGAIYVDGNTANLTNDTFWANSAGDGGAVYFDNGTNSVLNSTFVANMANYGGGAIYAYAGTGNVSVGSSLFANNQTYGGIQNACSTYHYIDFFVSLGGNVIQDGTAGSCAFGSADKYVKSLKLGAYGFHGGMAQTIPLVAKSAGTAFAPRATCQAKDARGVSRGTTGTCDAGAYQVTKK